MKILFLSQRFLLPMDTGGKIRTGKILEQISKKDDVTLISNIEYPEDEAYLSQIRNLCTKFIGVPWEETKKYSLIFWFHLISQMFSKYPVVALNDYSRALRDAVEKEVEKEDYDVAICDFVQSALLFKRIKRIPKILFQHNVESVIPERHFRQSINIFAKWFWWIQWKKMVFFEGTVCRSFNTVISVSKKDKKTFQALYQVNNVESIPTGVDVDYFKPQPDVKIDENNLVFCGSMDWRPNEDGIVYFIKEILPHIRRKANGKTLTIVGRNPSFSLQKLAETHDDIELTGWVRDVRPYIAKAAIVIVPIRIGGGTRIKIYEAMAMAKPVISTFVGAEGLPVADEKNIFIKNNPVRFAVKAVDLLADSKQRETIGTAARSFVRENFSWGEVANEFRNICRMTLEKRNLVR